MKIFLLIRFAQSCLKFTFLTSSLDHSCLRSVQGIAPSHEYCTITVAKILLLFLISHLGFIPCSLSLSLSLSPADDDGSIISLKRLCHTIYQKLGMSLSSNCLWKLLTTYQGQRYVLLSPFFPLKLSLGCVFL